MCVCVCVYSVYWEKERRDGGGGGGRSEYSTIRRNQNIPQLC